MQILWTKLLQKHFHSVNLEYTHVTYLTDLPRGKEFDSARAGTEIIPQRDAVLIVLHLSF